LSPAVRVGIAFRPFSSPKQRLGSRRANDARLKPGTYKLPGEAEENRPAGTREALPGTKIEQQSS